MNLLNAFGERIRALRKRNGLTQDELAERADLSVNAVGQIERGKFAPSLITLEGLSKALGVSLCELFDFDKGMQNKQNKPIETLLTYNKDDLTKLLQFKPKEIKKALKLSLLLLKECKNTR